MKVRKISIFNQLFILLAILLLMGNGILGIVAYRHSEKTLFTQIQGNVENLAGVAAAQVNGELLQGIEIGDENSEAYSQILSQLAIFRDNADMEYIYTLRRLSDGSVIFVVDSDPEEPAAIGDECEITDALEAAFLQGTTLADDVPFTDEWGTHVSAYSPIYCGDEIVGAVGVDLSANWIAEQTQTLRNMVIIVCIITYIISLLILGIIMLKFKKSMNTLNDKVLELVGGSGDLTKEIHLHTGDELEVIADNMNTFIKQIRVLVTEVARSTSDIVTTGNELNSTVQENARIMSDMNNGITGISSNMKTSATTSKQLSANLSASAENITAFAKQIHEISNTVNEANHNAQQTTQLAQKNRENTLRSIEKLSARMKQTSANAQKISEVGQIAAEIGEIASQTSMLSLNAQIEAARAGEQGRGFAVVASEVGKLSQDIDRSVTQINAINETVISALDALIKASEEMIDFVSVNVVQDYDVFARIGVDYENTTETIGNRMNSIEQKSAEIATTIADINETVQEITNTVLSTAQNANDLASATGTISSSLDNLNNTSLKNTLHTENLNKQLDKYVF